MNLNWFITCIFDEVKLEFIYLSDPGRDLP